MSVYREELLLRSKDVDMFRRLRSSELFRLLQEASIRHTEQLGMGRDKTLDKGILWVLLMQRAEIARMPEYDERIVLKSWPGRTMHLLFPRYYSIETAAGEPLLKASAVWSLIDAKTRRVVFPEKYGVAIEGAETGEEIAMPAAVAKAECSLARDFTVPYSFVDLNGHMNNTRYFDLAEDCVGEAERGRERVARVAGTERVARRFAPLLETREAAGAAQRAEAVRAAGEELPGVALVGDVEEDRIGRRVEDAQERDRELDDAEVAREVAAVGADGFDDFGADLRGERRQLVRRERLHVRGTADAGEDRAHA